MRLNSEKTLWLYAAGVLTAVFIASALIRPPGLPMKQQLPHVWLTCNTVKFARIWHREGAFALGFRMVEFPRSVEAPERKDRLFYTSYPPGSVIPVWLAAKMTGSEPSIKMAAAINLGMHFLVALGLAGIALNLLSGLGYGSRLAGGLGAGLFYLCAGAPFLCHWAVYFADTAVLLPVVLLLWLESFRALDDARRAWVGWAIPAVVFCGSLTDPLMVALAAVLSLWRLIAAEKGRRGKAFQRVLLELALPVLMAVGLFFLQLAAGGSLISLAQTFIRRSFLDDSPEKAAVLTPARRFINHFRIADLLLLLIPFVVALVRETPERARAWRKTRRQTALILVLFAACAVQMAAFWNHSFCHSFSVLKLYLPAGLMTGVTIALVMEDGRLRKVKLAVLGVFFLAMTAGLWRQETAKAKAASPYPFLAMANHIGQTAAYRDLYLSPVIAISNMPPQLLSFSMKRVWGVKDRAQIEAVLAGVRDRPCTLHFLVLDTPEIAGLFSRFPCGKSVHAGLAEYAVDARQYSAIAPGLAPLFKGQDLLYRKRVGVKRKESKKPYLVPWEK